MHTHPPTQMYPNRHFDQNLSTESVREEDELRRAACFISFSVTILIGIFTQTWGRAVKWDKERRTMDCQTSLLAHKQGIKAQFLACLRPCTQWLALMNNSSHWERRNPTKKKRILLIDSTSPLADSNALTGRCTRLSYQSGGTYFRSVQFMPYEN